MLVGTEGAAGEGVVLDGTIGALPPFVASSSFFCILALRAKIITRMTNPPQSIPTIHRMTLRTVPHPLDSVTVTTGACVVGSSEAHVVPSML